MLTPTSLVVVTQDPRMRELVARVQTIAASDTSVLLVGETGVGKELFADYIHRASPRSARPFVKISLSAMPHDLLESELFGHERGAYTNAIADKRGLFEIAHTGSFFLDDIDDVAPQVQVKLLRVLEMGQVMRVGGSGPIAVDVRLITASKIDLEQLVARNMFRADLFYRINVCPVVIPPLRERRGDIPLLVDHFPARFAPQKSLTLTGEARAVLQHYDWPGNVRELRNVVQRLALFAEGQVRAADLPPEIGGTAPMDRLVRACGRCIVDGRMSYSDVVTCLETNLLRQALADAHGNRSHAARALGLSLSTLRDKLRKFGLENEASHDADAGGSPQAE
jgi:two-component system, NtrC family, response regulator AtoC